MLPGSPLLAVPRYICTIELLPLVGDRDRHRFASLRLAIVQSNGHVQTDVKRFRRTTAQHAGCAPLQTGTSIGGMLRHLRQGA